MSASFDRWLEYSLRNDLAPAYQIEAVPARARYRQVRPAWLRARRTAARVAFIGAVAAVLGTVGAEAAGYGPVHVGSNGVYVKIGTPATHNPPVIPPTPTPAQVVQPTAKPAITPEHEDSSPRASARPEPSDSPERESSASPQPSSGAEPSGSAEPADH